MAMNNGSERIRNEHNLFSHKDREADLQWKKQY
jgi:hypothetical protein